MGRFKLSDDSNNTWKINSGLEDYSNKHIKTFVSNNTFIKGILSANPFPSNIKGDFLLDLHLRELPSEQGKRFTLNQDKSLVNLQQRVSFIMVHTAKLGQH